MKKIVLITGATSGIGQATALALANEDFDVIAVGRRNDRLETLKKHIEKTFKRQVQTLELDIKNREEVEQQLSGLANDWKNIDILVNNAGLALGLNHIQDGNVDDWEQMIDTNIKGMLYVTRMVAPWMIARKRGHIVNLCSTAGKDVYENGNVYCATKSAVNALSKAMRIDMLPYGIKVTNISPGAVRTEFSDVRFKGNVIKAEQTYDGMQPLTANDIAEVIRYAVTLPENICLNDIVITPRAQADANHTYRTK